MLYIYDIYICTHSRHVLLLAKVPKGRVPVGAVAQAPQRRVRAGVSGEDEQVLSEVHTLIMVGLWGGGSCMCWWLGWFWLVGCFGFRWVLWWGKICVGVVCFRIDLDQHRKRKAKQSTRPPPTTHPSRQSHIHQPINQITRPTPHPSLNHATYPLPPRAHHVEEHREVARVQNHDLHMRRRLLLLICPRLRLPLSLPGPLVVGGPWERRPHHVLQDGLDLTLDLLVVCGVRVWRVGVLEGEGRESRRACVNMHHPQKGMVPERREPSSHRLNNQTKKHKRKNRTSGRCWKSLRSASSAGLRW